MLIVSVREDKVVPEETDEAACGYKSLFATCRGWEVVLGGGNTDSDDSGVLEYEPRSVTYFKKGSINSKT